MSRVVEEISSRRVREELGLAWIRGVRGSVVVGGTKTLHLLTFESLVFDRLERRWDERKSMRMGEYDC